MEIMKIARTKDKFDPIKIYATVKGDSGNEYNVSYTRRGKKGAGFRGWICSCPNFTLSQFGKHGHCKHIDLIQNTYGRYGSGVGLLVPKVGDIVFVTKKANYMWTGKGKVERVDVRGRVATPLQTYVILRMIDGIQAGESGGFLIRDIAPVPTEVVS